MERAVHARIQHSSYLYIQNPNQEKEKIEHLSKQVETLSMEGPKLILNLFPSSSRRVDQSPSGTATPPFRLPGAVPFRWEEAPGKPKKKTSPLPENATPPSSIVPEADVMRLSLPPRLSASASMKKMIKWEARAENLDDVSSSSSGSLSSFKSLSSSGSLGWYGGGSGWESEGEVEVVEGRRTVRILRYKRKRATLACAASFTASHIWNNILARLKHAVVPRRRDTKS